MRIEILRFKVYSNPFDAHTAAKRLGIPHPLDSCAVEVFLRRLGGRVGYSWISTTCETLAEPAFSLLDFVWQMLKQTAFDYLAAEPDTEPD